MAKIQRSAYIVSIVGTGGLGKTTLAKELLEEIKGYHPKAFVPVGRNPDVKDILKDIIYELEKNFTKKEKEEKNFNATNLNVKNLVKKVKELLENKRFFIVIDDIWTSSEWNRIRPAFPDDKNGSRVMITTRDRDVAFTCSNFEKYVYGIKRLSDEDSRKLFFGRIFGPEKDWPVTSREEEISADILKKCGGMPLAIISIASRLAGKPETTWEYVWKSLGSLTDEGKDDHEKMKQILDLSYMHLPDHLKTCLLYVCMYPEDREIDKNELLREWVAEGFVITNGGRLEAVDVAEEYFKKLISMCMIQPGMIKYNNEVLSCRVHDIILDLVRSKSREEKFIHVIDGLKDVSGPIRRVSVQHSDKEDTRILEKVGGSLSHARSVLLYQTSLLPQFLMFKYVRVLRIEVGSQATDLNLTCISSLFLLRYLKAQCIGTMTLPGKIGALQQLETIDLYSLSERTFPSDIVRLPWLSHLSCFSCGIVLPDGIGRLKSLRTLELVSVFDSSEENIKGLGELTKLRKLQIELASMFDQEKVTTGRMDALHSSICKISASLRILSWGSVLGYISMKDFPRWSSMTPFPDGSHIQELHLSGCMFERCPEWIGQLHNLRELTIHVIEVADAVTVVASLPSLLYFDLAPSGGGKEESVVIPGSGSGAFRALKILIFKCPKARLTFEAGVMPRLENLTMVFPYEITRPFLPVGIQHLPFGTLNQISLEVHGGRVIRDSDSFRKLIKRVFEMHHPDADISIFFLELPF